MKELISCIVFLMLSSFIYAQNYNTAAGLRISNGLGLTVQQRVADKVTIEGIAFTNLNHSYLAVLGEYHGKLIRKGFNWYAGGGVHIGTEKDVDNPAGMLVVAGLEMKIKNIVLSADVMPRANFIGGSSVFNFSPGLSARYILVERPKVKLKDKIKEHLGKKKKKD